MAPESPVTLSLPRADLFQFPPNANSGFIPPPPAGSALAPPFEIPDHIYNAVLDPKVPITIAAVYAVSAKALNIYNKSTGNRPWAISKTTVFRWFVVFHNVALAVYSAWTWWGMLGAMRRTVVSPFGPQGGSGFVDSLCRINGPAGLGNAAFFDDKTNSWQTYSPEAVLDEQGAPSRFAAGRLWNEGLAFYGWIFYLSKFYEVVDTLIILAKGKLSSTLQTYHHAGAMMCMWAGIRYMSVPIWIFVFFNSFIHALMYTYYTVTAFRIRVPTFIKRTLTTMQITQFVVGASCAMIHSFITYAIPVVSVGSQTKEPASSASSAANNSVVAATGDLINSVKGTLGRQAMPCITSSGETFAVWLNVLYLAPLTYLFVSFFISSYLRRSDAQPARRNATAAETAARRLSSTVQIAEKAGWEAAKNVEREVYGESNEEAVVTEDAVNAEDNKANGRAASNGRVLRSRK